MLQTSFCRGGGDGGWKFVEQSLQPAPPVEFDPDTGMAVPQQNRRPDTLPAGTAFIEPFVGIDQAAAPGQFTPAPSQWAGLTIGILPKPPGQDAPPAPAFYQCDDGVQSFVVMPGSSFLAAGSTNGAVRLVSYPDAKEIAAAHTGDSRITHLFAMPAGGQFIAVNFQGGVYLVAFKPDPSVKLLYNSTIQSVLAAAITPDARILTLAGLLPPKAAPDPARSYPDTTLEATSLDTLKKLPLTVPGYPRHLFVTPDGGADGNKLVLVKTDTLSSAWQLPTFQRLPDITTPPPPAPTDRAGKRYRLLHPGPANEPAPCMDAQRKWQVALEDGRITVRDLTNPARLIWTSAPVQPGNKALAIVPSDGAILLLGADGIIRRFAVPDPAAPQTPAAP